MTDKALMIRDDIDTMTLGKVLAASGYFQDARDAAQCVVKVLAGRELGLGPVASMTGVYIVKGRPALSANLLAGCLKRTGRYTYRVRQLDDKAAEIAFFERNGDKWDEIGVSRFTADDAKRAGTQNMERFARNMLFARAMTNGIRWYAPDVFAGGVYTPEELGAPVDGEGDVVPPTAPDPVMEPAQDTAPANGHAPSRNAWKNWYKAVAIAQAEGVTVPVMDDAADDADIIRAGAQLKAAILAARKAKKEQAA